MLSGVAFSRAAIQWGRALPMRSRSTRRGSRSPSVGLKASFPERTTRRVPLTEDLSFVNGGEGLGVGEEVFCGVLRCFAALFGDAGNSSVFGAFSERQNPGGAGYCDLSSPRFAAFM